MDTTESRLGLFAAMLSMFVFAAVACGGGDSSDDDGNGTTDDVGTMADAGGTDTGGDETIEQGFVQLNQNRIEATDSVTTIAAARFEQIDGAGVEIMQEGDCELRFTEPDSSGDGEPCEECRSAGEISIRGGKADAITLTPGEDGSYEAETLEMTEFWDGAQTLDIEAAGDAVPSFSTTIQPTSGVELQSPELPGPQETWTVDTSQDLTVEWSSANKGAFALTLLATDEENDQQAGLRCNWDATAGSGTLPASLLGEMPKVEGEALFSAGGRTEVQAGDYTIMVEAWETVARSLNTSFE